MHKHFASSVNYVILVCIKSTNITKCSSHKHAESTKCRFFLMMVIISVSRVVVFPCTHRVVSQSQCSILLLGRRGRFKYVRTIWVWNWGLLSKTFANPEQGAEGFSSLLYDVKEKKKMMMEWTQVYDLYAENKIIFLNILPTFLII